MEGESEKKSSSLEDCWERAQRVHWHRRSWMKRQEIELGREVRTEILMKQLLEHSEMQ